MWLALSKHFKVHCVEKLCDLNVIAVDSSNDFFFFTQPHLITVFLNNSFQKHIKRRARPQRERFLKTPSQLAT